MKKKRKRPDWATSVSDYVNPCKGCTPAQGRYEAIIKTPEGGIQQIITCKDRCMKYNAGGGSVSIMPHKQVEVSSTLTPAIKGGNND